MESNSITYTLKTIKDGLNENCYTAGKLASMLRRQQTAMAEAGFGKISNGDRSFFEQLKEMNDISAMYVDFLTTLVDSNKDLTEGDFIKTEAMSHEAVDKMANMIKVSLEFPDHMKKVTVTQ